LSREIFRCFPQQNANTCKRQSSSDPATKKIKIKENKKDKNNNINGEKMRKDNEVKSREKSA